MIHRVWNAIRRHVYTLHPTIANTMHNNIFYGTVSTFRCFRPISQYTPCGTLIRGRRVTQRDTCKKSEGLSGRAGRATDGYCLPRANDVARPGKSPDPPPGSRGDRAAASIFTRYIRTSHSFVYHYRYCHFLFTRRPPEWIRKVLEILIFLSSPYIVAYTTYRPLRYNNNNTYIYKSREGLLISISGEWGNITRKRYFRRHVQRYILPNRV